MKEFVIIRDRDHLMKRMGDITQLAGLRRFVLSDGKAAGVEAVDIRTGSGLEFTVLPGRGMDIAWANYRGIPIAYMSKTGVTAPGYYDSEGTNWLRGFFGGLLTTCGLTNAGPPCETQNRVFGVQQHGQHGRITHMGADNICVSEQWLTNDYVMTVSGRLKEAVMFGECFTLTRKITAKLGESKFVLEDVVENHAFEPYPLMLLYHFNFGYPLLDDRSELVSSSVALPRDCEAEKYSAEYASMHEPGHNQREQVFFHNMNSNPDGITQVAIINRKLELGAYIRYNTRELPCFTEWKMLSEGDYVLGMEPGNCNPISLARQLADGTTDMFEPGEKRRFKIELGILDGIEQISGFIDETESLNHT